MSAQDVIESRRAAWDAAWSALADHYRCHREQRAWHPLCTQARDAADLAAHRQCARLDAAEVETRLHLASALRLRGFEPLANGLYREVAS